MSKQQWTNPHPLVSRQKADLKKAFQSAKSLDKQLKIFEKMQKTFQESELAFECISIARHHLIGASFDQALTFGKRALRILIENDNKNIAPLEEGCVELGEAYEFVFDTYLQLMNYEEAVPFGLKSIEAYKKCFGRNSEKVYMRTRNLIVVYVELGDYEKALEENEKSKSILDLNVSELLDVDSVYGSILIGLGEYEKAIDVLKYVVSHSETQKETRALSYFILARAFCCLEQFAVAENYLRTGLRCPEEMNEDTNNALRFTNMCTMSRMYEKKDDFEKAILLLGKALIISRILSKKTLAEGAARFFSLITLSGHKEDGISYMKGVVEKLKDKFGAEDCEVAHGYRHLGAAYVKSGPEELAVKFLLKAKDIMDVAHGLQHLDSLNTRHALAETYAAIGRYDRALEIEEKVVESFGVLEPRDQECLDRAVKLLNRMKSLVAESHMRASPQSVNEKDLSVKISKCTISDD